MDSDGEALIAHRRAAAKSVRLSRLAEWGRYRAPLKDALGRLVPYHDLIEARLRTNVAELPLTGIIGAWVLRETAYGNTVITGHCHRDFAGRGIALTLNSAYRLLSDEEHDRVLRGEGGDIHPSFAPEAT